MTTTLGRWAWRLATASLLLLPAFTAAAPCGGARHAVVIGINDYKNGVPPLRGARRDAERVAAALKARGYAVRLLLDEQASRDALRELLGYTLLNETKADDEVLVYFAGHGETLGSRGRPMGYLMPADADAKRPGVTGLAMSELVGWMSTWPAQRRLLVADACYSGLAVPSARRIRPAEAPGTAECRPSTRVPVTAVLVAGRQGDQANETGAGGVFTNAFLRALEGVQAADPNGDGWISHKALGGYLSEVVSAEVRQAWGREQVPQSGQIGEGAFYLRGTPRVQQAAPAQGQRASPSLDAARRARPAQSPSSDPGALFLEVASAFERKGDTAQQLRIYRDFIERFGDDPTQNGRVIQALAKTAEVHRLVGNSKDAQRTWQRLLEAYHRRGLGPDAPEVRYLAEALFRLGEDGFQAFLVVHLAVKPLTGSERQREKALKANRKAERALMRQVAALKNHYAAVIDHSSPGWTVAALYRVGRVHQHLAKVILAAPNPYPTEDERSAEHRAAIKARAAVLRGMAFKAFARAYQEANAHRIASEWTRKVFQALHAARPQDYPLEMEARRLRATP